jgi:hypothetical protein
MEEENILEEHGLTNDKITQYIDGFDDEFKRAFLRQLASNECSQKGNSITKKDCWAVTAVIRATIQANLANRNSIALPGMVPEEVPEEVPTRIPGAGPISEENDEPPENLRQVMNETNEDHELTNQEELGGEEIILKSNADNKKPVTPSSSDSSTRMATPGNNELMAAAPNNAYTRAIADAAASGVSIDEVLLEDGVGAAPAPAPVPAENNASYFEENPANFRKGQYGINLNRNNSKRFYANALVGTKRMRIRGRNAANIKTRYNAKKELLRQERLRLEREHTEAQRVANAAAATARAERQRLANTAAATRRAANIAAAEKKIRNRAERAAEAARVKAAKERAEGIRRAKVAAGEVKPSFMNRMRSIKNPFKRGGSRKTRRSTRRNRSNRR